jgi:hypothetical protein
MATLERAELIGKGFCADVYAWGEGRVLKFFHGAAEPERAEREFAATRRAAPAGLTWFAPRTPHAEREDYNLRTHPPTLGR